MITATRLTFLEQILLGDPSADVEQLSGLPEDVLVSLFPEVRSLGPAGGSARFKKYQDMFLHSNDHIPTLGIGDIIQWDKVNGKPILEILQNWLSLYDVLLLKSINTYIVDYNRAFNSQSESENRKYVCGFTLYALNALLLVEDVEENQENQEVLLAAEVLLSRWDDELRKQGFVF